MDEAQPFIVKSDASDIAVSATLNQDGRPLPLCPGYYKEISSIIEALGKGSLHAQQQ